MSDLLSSPAVIANVRELKPAAAADEVAVRADPLVVDYTTTRVVPELAARLRRAHGVVAGERSELAEAYKMLRQQVRQRLRPDADNLLAITSPRAIEGKSLAALNLALAVAAEYDTSVLLIDADLAGGGLQRLFGLHDAPGLSDHLVQHATIPSLLVNPGIDRFVLLPAGRAAADSSELLASRALQSLVHEMKRRYRDRYLIVDLPPILETADALAFLPRADATLLVVEERTTSLHDVDRAVELLQPYELLGSVITRARDKDDRPRARSRWWPFGARGPAA